MPKPQREGPKTTISPRTPSLQDTESTLDRILQEQMVRDLTPEETKRFLFALASDGDQEARDVLESFLAAYPNPSC